MLYVASSAEHVAKKVKPGTSLEHGAKKLKPSPKKSGPKPNPKVNIVFKILYLKYVAA